MHAAMMSRRAFHLSPVRRMMAWAGILACLAMLAAPKSGFAQGYIDQNNGTSNGGGGGGGSGGSGGSGGQLGRGGRSRGSGAGATQVARPVLAPIPAARDPWPRLDSGALICSSKAALEQHQAAVSAHSVDGSGCQLIQHMTPVTLVAHDGLARTEVSVPGASGPSLVWTDVFIPAEAPPKR